MKKNSAWPFYVVGFCIGYLMVELIRYFVK